MTDPVQPNDWQGRHAAVVAADGDEWDMLSDLFDADWMTAYKAAFVAFAVPRGWTTENAEVWASESAQDALRDGAAAHDWCPKRTAETDVPEAEWESTNAC